MTKTLDVVWGDALVGTLVQTGGGALKFSYAEKWLEDRHAPSLSISLPKRTPTFSEKECRPFFAGLLPEETQRRLAAAALGVSAGNDFALLDGLGEDVAGAIRFLPPGATFDGARYEPQTQALDDDALVKILDTLPKRPLLAGEDGLRLSLAGVQSKLPVVLVGDRIALPRPGQPTTHILKPPIPHLQGTTENEAMVMRLARAIGLDAAAVEPRHFAGRTFLLVTRYDRALNAEGRLERLHQEDFCQALGVLPHRKYAKEGGPGFGACFGLLRRVSTRPAKDILKLVDAALFNLIVGNADAHGKNFSLVHEPEQTRLAPLYDLLSTVQYHDLSPDLAMKIGRAARLDKLGDDDLQRFSRETGVGLPYIRRRGQELSDQIVTRLTAVRDELLETGLDEAAFAGLGQSIMDRADSVAFRVQNGKRAIRRQGVDVSIGPEADLNEQGSAFVTITNRSRKILTGCFLDVENLDPPVSSTATLRIAENLTLTPTLSKKVRLLVHGDNDLMLFQFKRTPNFPTPAGRGLFKGEHTFDLLFGSDQNLSAKVRCRAVVDPQGQMQVRKAEV